MSAPPNQSLNVSRQKMEQSIDHLADIARKGVEPVQFFTEVLDCALGSGGATRAILWSRSLDGKWQIAGEAPNGVHREASFIDQRQQDLNDASLVDRPYLLNGHSKALTSGTDSQSSRNTEILSPIRHSSGTVGILESLHANDDSRDLSSDTLPFFIALCEVTADFLAQQELEQLRQAQQQWYLWDQYSQTLLNPLELSSVCSTIANDGKLLADSDRVSVLIQRGRSFHLQSVSGTANIEHRSSTARTLEALSELVARHGRPIWFDSANNDGHKLSNNEDLSFLQQTTRDSKATGIGIIPIYENATTIERPRLLAVIILEKFYEIGDFSKWQSLGEQLASRSTPALKAANEIGEIPWLGLWKSAQHLSGKRLSSSKVIGLAAAAIVLLALALIPADFTVSGTAELWPAHRRDVFATSSGIVDRILVTHGDDVAKDQPLIILRDPELESSAPRILGEIATLSERLKGVQAARFIGNSAPDGISKSRQLTADEEELKERLRSLERQRVLIEERIASLTLCSPIAGKVLTWDVDQLLSSRPVERGQKLLTIGETSGPWIVEVRIPDKEAGYLLRARKSSNPELPVDFLVASEPGRIHHGRVQDVSLNSETDESSRSQVRVIVGIDRNEIEQPRAGATAVPRIHCGRRSLGYVWFHDFIDAIRTRLLF